MEKCLYCGCTNGHGCCGGCHWVLRNVCSNCVINVVNASKELIAYIKDPNVKKIEVLITEKDNTKSKLRVLSFNMKHNPNKKN